MARDGQREVVVDPTGNHRGVRESVESVERERERRGEREREIPRRE